MGVYRKQGAWWIDWYEGRRRRRKKTHVRTKREARKILQQVKAKILPSELGLFDPKFSCPELVNRYLEALKGTRAHQTWRRAELALRNFFGWCPVRLVLKLTPELFERYAARRKKDVCARTINIELANLKSCLNWGVRNDLFPRNPLAHARMLRVESHGRLRFLSEKEMRHLLQACRDTVYHDIFYTFLRTGMRKGELTHLRWDDVDFGLNLIRVGGHKDEKGEHHTKTYRERHIPMDKELAEIIARQPRRPGCPYVFGNSRDNVRENNLLRELKRHAKKAKIDDVTLHVLRHTFASHLVMLGADLPTVKELLGHSTIQMTMRYAHLAEGHLRAAVEKLKIPSYKPEPRVVAGPGFERTGT